MEVGTVDVPDKPSDIQNQKDDFIYNPYFISFAATIIISYILYVAVYIRACHASRHPILLLGLSRAGKSAIFRRLAYSKHRHPGSYPSETIDRYFCMGKRWTIIDIPGDIRLKHIYFDYYKQYTKGIIFVIDLMTIYEKRFQIAEYLYRILNDPVIRTNKVPLLIYYNRDNILPVVGDLTSIGRFLEKQIDIYKVYFFENNERFTVSEEDFGIYRFNVPMDPFYFKSCPFKVEFASGPIFTDDSDVSDLEDMIDWISNI